MNWLGLLTLGAAKDPELAPHSYLVYLLLWTFIVGFFVLFIFPESSFPFGYQLMAAYIHQQRYIARNLAIYVKVAILY